MLTVATNTIFDIFSRVGKARYDFPIFSIIYFRRITDGLQADKDVFSPVFLRMIKNGLFQVPGFNIFFFLNLKYYMTHSFFF